jgi:hypothetical protein
MTEDETGGRSSTYEIKGKWTQSFSGKTRRKETTCMLMKRRNDHSEIHLKEIKFTGYIASIWITHGREMCDPVNRVGRRFGRTNHLNL